MPKFQVNGVDVSHCKHEEAVKVFMEAKEPIVVEVKRKNSVTVVNGAQQSEKFPNEKSFHEEQIHQSPSSITREVQTELDTSSCLRCADYYNCRPEQNYGNIILPDLEYEVMACKSGYLQNLRKIMLLNLQKQVI